MKRDRRYFKASHEQVVNRSLWILPQLCGIFAYRVNNGIMFCHPNANFIQAVIALALQENPADENANFWGSFPSIAAAHGYNVWEFNKNARNYLEDKYPAAYTTATQSQGYSSQYAPALPKPSKGNGGTYTFKQKPTGSFWSNLWWDIKIWWADQKSTFTQQEQVRYCS